MSLPSTCEIPNAPAAVGRALVVGDGTPESCTNAELQAAASAGGDIIFDCGAAAVTIPITSTLVVAKDASIDGGGKVTLDGQGTVRILSADNYVNVALRGLTFTRGLGTTGEGAKSGGAVRGGWRGSLDIRDCNFTDNEAGTNGEEGGGAIYTPSRTTLTVVNCRFTGNRAGTGGALFNLLSGLTVVNSVFVNNQALAGGGGGVYTDGASDETDDGVGGVISLCGCRFQDNIGKSQGGAAYLFAYSPDHVIVNQCIFERNQVLELNDGGALGGGLRVGNAQLDLEQSLFVGNHSDGHAGGLWVDGAYPSYVTNSTFSGNDAGVEGATDAGYGGAISGANLSMLNLTIVENRAVSGGGGIFNEDTTSTLTNSVLSNNRANNQWGIKLTCRQTMKGARNLQWPAPGNDVACTEGVTSSDPMLGALTDNGGPTKTLLPDEASPVLGAGRECPSYDQRGTARVGDCDLGAVER